MTTEQTAESPQIAEVELRVRVHGQEDAVLSREYVSPEKRSTDGILGEIFAGIYPGTKERFRPVNDQG